MEQTVIDLTPRQEPHDPQRGFGREVLREVYYRIQVPYYTYTFGYSDAYRKEAETGRRNVLKYYEEIIAILQAAGWTLATSGKELKERGACPDFTKGNQRLYCHPQSISGCVDAGEVDDVARLFSGAMTFSHYKTDDYRDVIVTASTEDELLLYRQVHGQTARKVLEELATTKRRNLYKSETDVFYRLAGRLRIDTKRAGQRYGLGNVEHAYAEEVIREAKADGWLVTATGRDGIPLVRWPNRAEQKKLSTH